MEDIVRSLNLPNVEGVLQAFRRENITTAVVPCLSPEDFVRLGISRLGDQVLLKQRCRRDAARTGSVNTPSSNNTAASVASERRGLFGFLQRGGKGGKKRPASPGFKRSTLKIFCLADRSSEKLPLASEREELLMAGLGEKHMEVPANASAQQVAEAVLETFPRLRSGGGFSYLRLPPNSKTLVDIPPCGQGYTSTHLKDIVRSGRIFVRPIQRDLSLEPEEITLSPTKDVMETCLTCGVTMAMGKLKQHVENHERAGDDLHSSASQIATVTITSTASTVTDTSRSHLSRNTGTNPTSCSTLQGGEDVASTSRGNVEALPAALSTNELAYDNYANLLGDSDEDSLDGDLSIAIANSLRDANRPRDIEDVVSLSLTDVLSEYAVATDNVPVEETQLVIVRRRRLLHSVTYAVKQPQFTFDKLVRVQFVGEEAVDAGGPRREMFRLLMQAVGNEMGVLEGKPESRYFTHDVGMLEKETYYLAGKLVRWSITQGGPGLPVFAPQLYSFMFNETVQIPPTYDIITDHDVHEKLKKLATCSEGEYPSVVDCLGDWAADNGITGLYRGKFPEKEQIVSSLIKQHIFYRTQAEIMQFKRGLGNLVIGIEQFPGVFRPLFTSQSRSRMTREEFKKLVNIVWSPEGSNLRSSEEDTVYSWELFLQDCEDGNARLSLEDVLVFITGSDCIPPMGFSSPIELQFVGPSDHKTYPTASTCALQLRVPRGLGEPPAFRELMEEAVINSKGFGQL